MGKKGTDDSLKNRIADSLGTKLKLPSISAPETIEVEYGGEVREVSMDAVRFAGAMVDRESIEVKKIPLTMIELDPNQPRKTYDEQAIDERAESLKTVGQLQPARVYWFPDTGKYRLVFGHLRYLGACKAELPTLDCVVVPEPTDRADLLILQLTENTSRTDMRPLELADSFAEILELTGQDAQWLAKRLGKAKSTIYNALRLRDLPDQVRDYIASGDLAVGSAYMIARLPDVVDQIELAIRVLNEDLSRDEVTQEVAAILGLNGQTDTADAKAEMQLFALLYDGAAGPSCYLSAVDLEAAKSYCWAAIPGEVAYTLIPQEPSEVAPGLDTLRVLRPSDSLTQEFVDEMRDRLERGISIASDDAPRLTKAKAWLGRKATDDTKLHWDQWSEFDVPIDTLDGPAVRVVFRGDAKLIGHNGKKEVEVNIQLSGPLRAHSHWFALTEDAWASAKREGLWNFCSRAVRQVWEGELAEFRRDWKTGKDSYLQWRRGVLHYIPAAPPLKPVTGKPASFPENRPEVQAWIAPPTVGGWDMEGWNTEDAICVNWCVDPQKPYGDGLQAEFSPGTTWDDIAEHLLRAAHAAAFNASLAKIVHPAGTTVKPGDRVAYSVSPERWATVLPYDPEWLKGEVRFDFGDRLGDEPIARVTYGFDRMQVVEPEPAPIAEAEAKPKGKKGKAAKS